MPALKRKLSFTPVISLNSFPYNEDNLAVSLLSLPGDKRRRDEVPVPGEPDLSSGFSNLLRDCIHGDGNAPLKLSISAISGYGTQSHLFIKGRGTLVEACGHAPPNPANCRTRKSQHADVKDSDLGQSQDQSASLYYASATATYNADQPVVDSFNFQLGIGWNKISDQANIQAAARGWARFIENHYPLSCVRILLESKGLQSYLVGTSQGFYLFSEDLRQARLVSRDIDRAVQNLRFTPPRFEGPETEWRTYF